MFEHLRPMALMQAYCTGKGVCERPGEVAMAEILSGDQPHDALLNNFDQIDWSNVIEEASALVPQKRTDDQEADKEGQKTLMCESDFKVKPWCMKKGIEHVTKHSVMKVKAMCQETKCAMMKKMCHWMAQNREV